MSEKGGIKAFVRNVLGCGCPDEVFDFVELGKGASFSGVRLNIGNRLLIYVTELEADRLNKGTLKNLLALGRDERDGLGFNRFRLVLAVDEPEAVIDKAGEMLSISDDRAHLHVVQRSDVGGLLYPATSGDVELSDTGRLH
jgi:hypothetical protein